MTKTISRSRLRRGERSRTRVRVPDDRTAPKRRRLRAVGGATKSEPREAAPRAPRSRVTTLSKDPRRRRPRLGSAAVPESGRTGRAAARDLPRARPSARLSAPGARPPSREAAKLGRIRDGRYARGRSRFVV
jgi:hypothetical protein